MISRVKCQFRISLQLRMLSSLLKPLHPVPEGTRVFSSPRPPSPVKWQMWLQRRKGGRRTSSKTRLVFEKESGGGSRSQRPEFELGQSGPSPPFSPLKMAAGEGGGLFLAPRGGEGGGNKFCPSVFPSSPSFSLQIFFLRSCGRRRQMSVLFPARVQKSPYCIRPRYNLAVVARAFLKSTFLFRGRERKGNEKRACPQTPSPLLSLSCPLPVRSWDAMRGGQIFVSR